MSGALGLRIDHPSVGATRRCLIGGLLADPAVGCRIRSARCMSASSSSTSSAKQQQQQQAKANKNGRSSSSSSSKQKEKGDEEGEAAVGMISTRAELAATLAAAGDRLVVVEYAASTSGNSKRIYPAVMRLSRACPEVDFRLLLADESEETRGMAEEAGVRSVPSFLFYRAGKLVHREEGITEERLLGDVLYYGGDVGSRVQQLRSAAEVEAWLRRYQEEDAASSAGDAASATPKLLVLDVGLRRCGPCVKVYPTVVKLARRMAGAVVFARLHGDDNAETAALLRRFEVVDVPTFLFFREGQLLGRYVGSGSGELIGEILKHQGVRVTY